MKFLFVFLSFSALGQYSSFNDTIQSLNFGSRSLKIAKISSKFQSSEDTLPLVIVLDAEHLFYGVVSVMNRLYFEGKAPRALIVGIDQDKINNNSQLRYSDSDSPDFLPFVIDSIPLFLKRKEKANFSFYTAIGFSYTGGFIDSSLMTDTTNKISHIGNISPGPWVDSERLISTINNKSVKYFCSTSDEDYLTHQSRIMLLDSLSQKYNNIKVCNFPNGHHYKLTWTSLPPMLEFLFNDFDLTHLVKSIDFNSKKQLREKIIEVQQKCSGFTFSKENFQGTFFDLWYEKKSKAMRLILDYIVEYDITIEEYIIWQFWSYYYSSIGDGKKSIECFEKCVNKIPKSVSNKNDFVLELKKLKEKYD